MINSLVQLHYIFQDDNTKITPTLINNFIRGIHTVAGSEFKVCMHIDGFKSEKYSQLNRKLIVCTTNNMLLHF